MADASGIVILAGAITAAASLGGTIYTTRATRAVATKQADLEEEKVEREAYELAQSINRETLDRLQSEITRLQTARTAEQAEYLRQVTDLQTQIRTLRETVTTERGISDDLRRRVRALERDVSLLKRTLQANNVAVPDLSS